MQLDLYNQIGEKVGQIEGPDQYFNTAINTGLMHEAMIRQKANARKPIAHTKTRSDVKGTTKKIYRQKGTGGARHGSKKANLFRGGGVVFGPSNKRNFEMDMPKKMRRKALFSTLSARTQDNDIFGLDKYETEEIKTKSFNEMLGKLPESKNYLFVIPQKNEFIEKSAKNIPNVKVLLVNYLNISDLLKYRKIVFLKDAIDKLSEIFKVKQQ
ncbi:50S ribosomal protein L4 [Patescibacteria group bacterium]|nr:50S ribosomal protein L4 [Patescibacteria group bacterium]